jgi:hypothetical protein
MQTNDLTCDVVVVAAVKLVLAIAAATRRQHRNALRFLVCKQPIDELVAVITASTLGSSGNCSSASPLGIAPSSRLLTLGLSSFLLGHDGERLDYEGPRYQAVVGNSGGLYSGSTSRRSQKQQLAHLMLRMIMPFLP